MHLLTDGENMVLFYLQECNIGTITLILEINMNVNEKSTLDEFLDQIGQLFEKNMVEATARETKFVQRESKLTGHLFLITYTFAMSIYANPTLEQLTAL